MIKSIKIDYPEYWVKVSETFWPWVNVLEKPNGYGKTIILRTILSAYSGTFIWSRTLPSGSAEIILDDKTLMMSKSMWIGIDKVNAIAKHIMPWAFMDLSTPEQRKTIVDLLEIDRLWFLSSAFDWFLSAKGVWEKQEDGSIITTIKYSDTLAKETKQSIAESKWKEDQLLSDITRLQWNINSFKKKEFKDIDNYNIFEQEVVRQWSELVSGHQENVRKSNSDKSLLESNKAALLKEYSVLQSQLNGTCPTCNQSIDVDTTAINSKIDQNITEWKEIADKLSKFKTLDALPILNTLEEKAKHLAMEIPKKPAEARYTEQHDYNNQLQSQKFTNEELELKKKDLRELWELDNQAVLDCIDRAQKEFTKTLEKKISSLWLEIELFKTQKNGTVKETFNVSLDGKPYSELSQWNKIILQVKMALVFIKKLWLDFMLIDEAGTLGQESFDMIVKACSELDSNIQIIAMRPPYFKVK